jgi:hypothetical protein
MGLQIIYKEHLNVCVISVKPSLFWDFTQLLLLVSYWRLKVGPIDCPETSAKINQRCVTSGKGEDHIYAYFTKFFSFLNERFGFLC